MTVYVFLGLAGEFGVWTGRVAPAWSREFEEQTRWGQTMGLRSSL